MYIHILCVRVYIYSMDLYLCGSLFPPDAGSTSPHVPVLLGGWRLSPAIPAAIYQVSCSGICRGHLRDHGIYNKPINMYIYNIYICNHIVIFMLSLYYVYYIIMIMIIIIIIIIITIIIIIIDNNDPTIFIMTLLSKPMTPPPQLLPCFRGSAGAGARGAGSLASVGIPMDPWGYDP